MGNCQAIDSASLVIQQPNGKAERLYWPVSAGEVMKTNPGHYVALLISSTLCPSKDNEKCHDKSNDNPINNNNPVRITRIKLLKPTDTLVLGQVYRLIATQDVMKGLLAKKQAKMQKSMTDSSHKLDWVKGKAGLETDKSAAIRSETEDKQVIKAERQRRRTGASGRSGSISITTKSRTWQPSLRSISESAS